MICESAGCDCAFTSTTLNISVANGVVTIEQAEFTDITDIQNRLAILESNYLTLPATYVNASGDTMSGLLTINASASSLRLMRTGDSPFQEWHRQDGTRMFYIQALDASSAVLLQGETGMALRLASNATERMRLDSAGNVLFGKTASSTATLGVEINGDVGRIIGVADALNQVNGLWNRISAANADGQAFHSFRQAGTQIGSITRATSTTTGFNTSSDERLKENIVEVDDQLSLLWMRTAQPMMFNFKADPTRQHVGYIAQRLAAAWPEAIELGIVKVGRGDPDDEDFEPWEIDYSKFTPFIHSALQALDRTLNRVIDQARNRITALEGKVAALEARG